MKGAKVAKAKKPAEYKLAAGKVLVLRTCKKDLSAYGGFKWPASGKVSCPDWEPTKECGNGLHGLLWGEGDVDYLNLDSSAKWLVVEVDADSVLEISRKVKFPEGVVIFAGARDDAVALIQKHAPKGTACVFGTATAGDCGTATAGAYGTATAGAYGTATAGYRGIATAGDRGTATAGEYGIATAGDRGTATAGECGTATAGDRGTATAGEYGSIVIRYYDFKATRYRLKSADVGDNGIEPNVKYRLNDKAEFEKVTE